MEQITKCPVCKILTGKDKIAIQQDPLYTFCPECGYYSTTVAEGLMPQLVQVPDSVKKTIVALIGDTDKNASKNCLHLFNVMNLPSRTADGLTIITLLAPDLAQSKAIITMRHNEVKYAESPQKFGIEYKREFLIPDVLHLAVTKLMALGFCLLFPPAGQMSQHYKVVLICGAKHSDTEIVGIQIELSWDASVLLHQ